jgi:AraC-like DNA-binding protein
MDDDAFELHRRAPGPRTRHLISALVGYRETRLAPRRQHQAAALVVPFVISFGTPFHIALGREAGDADGQRSFAAGLYAGPVHIRSDGAAACVQVDFTPIGAYRCFGGVVVDLAARMVDLGDLLGLEGLRLIERLAAARTWDERFDLVEDFVARRDAFAPSPEIAHAYARLDATAGTVRIGALAADVGWSRKHLAHRFRSEIGLPPKVVARMMRFRGVCRLAYADVAPGWASIAIDSGYADQAHLVRDFVDMAGEPPGAWARRMAASDPRLMRLAGPGK